MKDLKILLDNYDDLDNESKFASISDDIWQLGSLEEIKKEVSHEAFIFHISVNLIGNWKCDGWQFIFAEYNSLLPYVAAALDELGLSELKTQFDNTVLWLREYFSDRGMKFLNFEQASDEKAHCDAINFLTNYKFKVNDENLNYISMDDRKLASQKYKAEIEKLDALSSQLWGYGAAEDGWKDVSAYIKKLYNS